MPFVDVTNNATAQAALKEMIDNKEIALVGGIYDISTGEVEFFEK